MYFKIKRSLFCKICGPFNAYSKSLSWILVSSILSGCSYFLKDEVPKQEAVKVSAQSEAGKCLPNVSQDLVDYLNEDADLGKAESAIHCIEKSIDLFEEKTRGERLDLYTEAELMSFIGHYLSKGNVDHQQLISVVLQIKSSLIGGSPRSVSREELARIKEFIVQFRTQLGRLNEYRDIYVLHAELDGSVSRDLERLERAVETIVSVAQELGKSFAPIEGVERQGFSFSTLQEIAELTPSWSPMAEYITLVSNIKSILVGMPANTVNANEWPFIFDKMSRLYGIYLRFRYVLRGNSFLFGEQLNSLESVVKEGVDLLISSAETHTEHRISLIEWENLIDELDRIQTAKEVHLLPFGIRASSLKNVLRPLFTKVFRPDPNEEFSGTIGLTKSGAEQALAEFYGWLAGQRLAKAMIQEHDYLRVEALVRELNDLPADGQLNRFEVEARKQMHGLLAEGRILAWDKEGRVRIEPRSEGVVMSRSDLIMLNAIRSGVNVVIRSYSRDVKRRELLSGVTSQEAQEFYSDVREVGIDLGFMDPRTRNAGERSFMEGNLFTSVGNGDSLLDPHETVEFFALILTGGRVSSRIEKFAADECRIGERDVLDGEKMEVDCFRRHLRENFAEYFSHLPGMVHYIEELSEDDGGDDDAWIEFMEAAENASRSSGYSDAPIETTELRVMVPIIQYAESLFTNLNKHEVEDEPFWDKINIFRDKPGELDEEELWEGFPIFQGLIEKLAGGNSVGEYFKKWVYSYLVTFNSPPSGVWSLVKGSPLVLTKQFWQSANRTDLLKIISSINLSGINARIQLIEEYFDRYGSFTLETEFRRGNIEVITEARELFQCPVEVQTDFIKMAKSRSSILFARGLGNHLESKKFVSNVSKEIRRYNRLASTCRPPM